MISIVGLGNAASAIVEKFKEIPQYQIYVLNDKVEKNTSHAYNIPSFETPEEYEEKIPKLKKRSRSASRKRVRIRIGDPRKSQTPRGEQMPPNTVRGPGKRKPTHWPACRLCCYC